MALKAAVLFCLPLDPGGDSCTAQSSENRDHRGHDLAVHAYSQQIPASVRLYVLFGEGCPTAWTIGPHFPEDVIPLARRVAVLVANCDWPVPPGRRTRTSPKRPAARGGMQKLKAACKRARVRPLLADTGHPILCSRATSLAE